MKETAEELAEKYYNKAVDWGGRRSDHIANMESAMKEYAKEALDEYEQSIIKWINDGNEVEFGYDIYNVPKPELK